MGKRKLTNNLPTKWELDFLLLAGKSSSCYSQDDANQKTGRESEAQKRGPGNAACPLSPDKSRMTKQRCTCMCFYAWHDHLLRQTLYLIVGGEEEEDEEEEKRRRRRQQLAVIVREVSVPVSHSLSVWLHTLTYNNRHTQTCTKGKGGHGKRERERETKDMKTRDAQAKNKRSREKGEN